MSHIDAAEEIKRLRAERDEARKRAAWFLGLFEIMGDMLVKRRSRRSAYAVAKEYAEDCGWDCFKKGKP